MKKQHLLSISILAVSLILFSCNSGETKKSSEDSKGNEKLEVKNLEDFAQFECHEDIEEYFGEENVDSTVYYVAEGTEMFLVSIINPDSKNKVVVYWKQKSGDWSDFETAEAIYSSYDSEWEMATDEGEVYPIECGLHCGSSLEDFEKENGAPFGFYGFGWDFGGYVFDLQEKLSAYIFVIGCPEMDNAEEFSPEYMNLLGDSEFSSDDEAAKLCDLRIVSIKYLGED